MQRAASIRSWVSSSAPSSLWVETDFTMGGSASNKSTGKAAGKSESSAGKASHSRPSGASRTHDAPRANSGERALVGLQKSIGNRAVGQHLQSNLASTNSAGEKQSSSSREPSHPHPADFIKRAARESGAPLDQELRSRMEDKLRVRLDTVRVHSGPDSRAAAESIGARAYTIGSDIYLGNAAFNAGDGERTRLLTHEAIHTVQQGSRPVSLQGAMRISNPGDAAEVEADRLSRSFASSGSGSPALALRSAMRSKSCRHGLDRATIARVAVPTVQRDLVLPHKLPEGAFNMNMKTISRPGGKSGMYGEIKFMADDTAAPDSKNIRLLQVAKTVDLSTGKDLVWTGDEANRNKVMTPAGAAGVQQGFFVDVVHKTRTPRTSKTDPDVSPYYIDDYKALGSPRHKDGSKKGKAVTEASLGDFPGSSVNIEFSFETVAMDSDNGHVFGTVMWGFSITDASKGKVEKERSVGREVTLKSTNIAIQKLNEVYR